MQTLGFKYTKNVLVAGAPPQTPLWEITAFLRHYSWIHGEWKGRGKGTKGKGVNIQNKYLASGYTALTQAVC